MPVRASKAEQLLNQWCAQNNLIPKFNFQHDDMKNNYNQICKLTVPGHDYVAIGVNKKRVKAISLCCVDFMEYLKKELGLNRKALLGIEEAFSKCSLNEPTSKIFNAGDEEYKMIVQKIKLKNISIDETDCLDANACEHGNWTSGVAKKNLMIFTKTNEIKHCDFKYTTIEKKFYTANISVYIKTLNKYVTACQPGKNKLAASNRCSLSVIRQLFHLGIVEGYTSSMSSTEKSDILHKKPGFKVKVDPQLVDRVYNVLDKFGVEPVVKKDDVLKAKQSFSLIPDVIVAEYREFNPLTTAKVVQWSPPSIDVDPWRRTSDLSSNDTLDEMSEYLAIQFKTKFHNSSLSKSLSKCNKLPIYSRAIEILDAIEKNSVVIIEGSTGCGKTTQVSQLILDDHLTDNKGAYCNIICTQPRKLSAITVANRIASERGEVVGKSVGYAVRFDHLFPRSHGSILVCTDGILMRRLEYGLHGISHIIVDEIHERHADTDFLMIVLKDMVERYPDIRVILMSATIDIELFSSYFYNCPVITIEGTCHPIKEFFLEDIVQKLNFQPKIDKKKFRSNNQKNNDENCNLFVSDDYPTIVRERVAMISEDDQHFELVEALLASIDKNERPENKYGAVLIFLPGWDWIVALKDYLKKKISASRYIILPLHSKLPNAEQEKVFQKAQPGQRKLILSTNIAETSITIEDIVYVIDYGKARVNVFTPRDNTINFVTVWVSKANKRQRMGRAGRVKPGYCFHLCSKARYNRLDDHIVPEITRLPLVEIGLGIKLLKLGDIGSYLSRAIQPPPMESVIEAESMLQSMKCLGKNLELTTLGLIAARLQLWPNLTRMIVLASFFKLGDPLSIVAAVNSDQCDLFMQDPDQHRVKQSFSKNYCSDQIVILNAFYQWQYMHRNNISDYEFCEYNILSWGSLMSAINIKTQIQQKMIKSGGFPKDCYSEPAFDFEHDTVEDSPDLDLLPAIMTAGFYPNVCYHEFGRRVILKDKIMACIHKSSVNYNQGKKTQFPSPFFVFADKLQTGTTLFSMQMTMVTPIHLLLFGSMKIEYINNSVVLDDWIRLDMDVKSAAAIAALRPVIEEIMVRAVEQPECMKRRTEADLDFIQVLQDLCNFNAGTHGMRPIKFD